MTTIIVHQAYYTSMKCYRESDEPGTWTSPCRVSKSDEVYAIFVTADWHGYLEKRIDKPILNVFKTEVQTIDAGETKGANSSSDDIQLWGHQRNDEWKQMHSFDKFFILVQAMEHDNSDPDGIVKLLQAVLPPLLKNMLDKVPPMPRDRIVNRMKRHMKKTIDQAANLDARVFNDNNFFLAMQGLAEGHIEDQKFEPLGIYGSPYITRKAIQLIDDPDDRIASPKELISRRLFDLLQSIAAGKTRVVKRRTLQFRERGQGTKDFHFTLRGKYK